MAVTTTPARRGRSRAVRCEVCGRPAAAWTCDPCKQVKRFLAAFHRADAVGDPDPAARERRLARYAGRAARGLPLFEGGVTA